ncbi:MAG: hypothetical protein HPY46_04905 [Candidatus Aminicenantes bacterium]|nr:hypothetical protein [Candidatus Aminicenantes bacterium]
MDLIIDSNALIDLIKLQLINVINRLPGYRFHILREVYNEIIWPEQKKVLQQALRSHLFSLESLVDIEELELFSRLSSNLGSGEAASLAYAYCHNYYLLSDENNRVFMREVRGTITERKLKRLPEIMAECISRGLISLREIRERIEKLESLASSPRDVTDVEHLKRVLSRVEGVI